MKTKATNEVLLEFPSRSSNEGFARAAVACFAAQMDPTLNELEMFSTLACSRDVCFIPSYFLSSNCRGWSSLGMLRPEKSFGGIRGHLPMFHSIKYPIAIFNIFC